MTHPYTWRRVNETRKAVPVRHLVVAGLAATATSALMIGIFLPFLLPFFFVVPIFVGALAWSLAEGERKTRQAVNLAQAHLRSPESTDLCVIEGTKARTISSTELVSDRLTGRT